MPILKRFEQGCQLTGRQVIELHAWLVEVQLVLRRAVTGQVNKDQVFLAAALAQGLNAAAQAGAGGQGTIGQVVTVVDQGDQAVGGEAFLQQVADIIGFAHEYTLLAVTRQGQGIQLDSRC